MPGALQRSIAAVVLVILSPVLIGIAIAVRATSPGPVIHRAKRISRGQQFTLLKFRTMVAEPSPTGPSITASGDLRVTPLGRLLRRSKLDELPQLWNVVRGEMVLVGPRPEDPQYVDWSNPRHLEVFRATPGITGPAAIAFRDEEQVLAAEAEAIARELGRKRSDPGDLERAYRERILPTKLAMDVDYLRTRSLRGDIGILWRTIATIFTRRARRPPP
jgi:lipopolysaccharide/colanic/teichoic acid biosynthesis glycosyltransferase